MTTSQIDSNSNEINIETIREELIQTAVKFLQNQNVVGTPLAQKQKFLQKKGLTDREIQIACERSGAYVLHKNQTETTPSLPTLAPVPIFYQQHTQIKDAVEDLSKVVKSSVDELREGLANVKLEVDKINHVSESNTQRQLQSMQSDVSTIKGLLLSRKQFPSVSNSPVVPPSIPAWQLASVPQDGEQDPKSEEIIEFGSGSTSSEPEQGAKNSDSSLEIM
ncbi:hypothetical protein Trydic_g12230 [Trypoxylus dichotomus]